MSDALASILTGTAGLAVAALAAAVLTARRPLVASDAERRSALRAAALALACQAAHFAEELATGFGERFPRLLGLAPWPPRFFVAFNAAWLAVWALSLAGLAARSRLALFPLWFLALASLANGVAHPVFSLRAGGYFPGLATSPLVGVAGLVLLRRLLRATRGW